MDNNDLAFYKAYNEQLARGMNALWDNILNSKKVEFKNETPREHNLDIEHDHDPESEFCADKN